MRLANGINVCLQGQARICCSALLCFLRQLKLQLAMLIGHICIWKCHHWATCQKRSALHVKVRMNSNCDVHCRPGRLDKILYVPLPPPEGRGAILQALTRKTPLAVDVDVGAVGASPQCHGFSGADLAALVREACICALKVSMPPSYCPFGLPHLQDSPCH